MAGRRVFSTDSTSDPDLTGNLGRNTSDGADFRERLNLENVYLCQISVKDSQGRLIKSTLKLLFFVSYN